MLIRLEQLDTVAERLTVKVLVIPQEDMVNQRLHVLTTDTAVRMQPPNDLGDLVYPAGKSPAQVATTIEARGDNNNWPFDSYITDTLSAQALVGGGDGRYYKPTRVEVTGALEGWDVTVRHVGGPGQEPWEKDNAIITLHRARAPLMFDLESASCFSPCPPWHLRWSFRCCCARGNSWHRSARGSLRCSSRSSPSVTSCPARHPGAWIDQGLVIWVLVGLVAAMVVYMISWYQQSD